MATATLPLPSTPTTFLFQAAASRMATGSRSGELTIGADGLALHLTAQGGAAAAVELQTGSGANTTRERRTAAAAYQVDLDLNVALSAALAGQQARLFELDPELLDDFTAAFNALDGSKAHQRTFFRATDHLFNALEQEVGLSSTGLDDEAEVVKGAVRDFFHQVKAMDRSVQKAVGGVAEVADRLASQAAQVVAKVAASDAPPIQRLRQADQLVGDAAVEGGARRHLRHLVDRLLARGDEEGKQREVGARLDGAREALATAKPHHLRRAGHALERALDRDDPSEAAANRFAKALTHGDDHPEATDHAEKPGHEG